MSAIDSKSLLQAISTDHPAGPDLEYDPDFLALMEAAAGTPERRMGDSVVPAQDPEWRRVLDLSTGLLQRTKDLRVAVLMTRALIGLRGLPGMQEGLTLIRSLLAEFWDGLYPVLDPSDGNDPTERLNCLLTLADRNTVLAQLRVTPLVRSRVFGAVAWRDVEIAEGKAPALPERQPLDSAAISGAFQDCDLDDLAAAAAAAAASVETLVALGTDLDARVTAGETPNLEPLIGQLVPIRELLQRQLAARRPDAAAATVTTGTSSGASVPTPAAATPSAPGQINSREDVVRTLDRVCDYYSRHEPSSPVPLLLQRARRLVTGSFVDILRDLAPDALPQIERVCGIQERP